MAKILSTEDASLSGASIRTSSDRIYKDIDLSLAKNPTTGDIYKKTDAASVKQAVMNIIRTSRFEKPFKPSYGADLTNQLFELATEDTGEEIRAQIYSTIKRYEPRCEIRDLQVNSNPDNNSINVTIEFKIVNTQQIVSFETTLSRLR